MSRQVCVLEHVCNESWARKCLCEDDWERVLNVRKVRCPERVAPVDVQGGRDACVCTCVHACMCAYAFEFVVAVCTCFQHVCVRVCVRMFAC
jgi:hypothetical protein